MRAEDVIQRRQKMEWNYCRQTLPQEDNQLNHRVDKKYIIVNIGLRFDWFVQFGCFFQGGA